MCLGIGTGQKCPFCKCNRKNLACKKIEKLNRNLIFGAYDFSCAGFVFENQCVDACEEARTSTLSSKLKKALWG
jgi:hypothetical protein